MHFRWKVSSGESVFGCRSIIIISGQTRDGQIGVGWIEGATPYMRAAILQSGPIYLPHLLYLPSSTYLGCALG